jgi:hypothetical protein
VEKLFLDRYTAGTQRMSELLYYLLGGFLCGWGGNAQMVAKFGAVDTRVLAVGAAVWCLGQATNSYCHCLSLRRLKDSAIKAKIGRAFDKVACPYEKDDAGKPIEVAVPAMVRKVLAEIGVAEEKVSLADSAMAVLYEPTGAKLADRAHRLLLRNGGGFIRRCDFVDVQLKTSLSEPGGPRGYVVPYCFPFNYFVMPHYTAEMISWTGFAICSGCSTPSLVVWLLSLMILQVRVPMHPLGSRDSQGHPDRAIRRS